MIYFTIQYNRYIQFPLCRAVHMLDHRPFPCNRKFEQSYVDLNVQTFLLWTGRFALQMTCFLPSKFPGTTAETPSQRVDDEFPPKIPQRNGNLRRTIQQFTEHDHAEATTFAMKTNFLWHHKLVLSQQSSNLIRNGK